MVELKDNNYLIVDASGYIYRAFHALPDLRTPEQFPTGAIFGFVRMLEKTIKRFNPEKIAIVFDPPSGRSWRHDIYDQYKANRDRMPDDLVQQIQPIKDIVGWMGLKKYEVEGQEADDVIATLAGKTSNPVYIASSDKDLMQLVDDRVHLIHPMTDALIDASGVEAKFGVKPSQMLDYLALVGDTSDHVPGVPKVGPKTAAKWLQAYGSVQALVDCKNEIKGKVGENLRMSIDQLGMAQELISLKEDLEVSWDHADPGAQNHAELYALFKQLHLKRFAKKHEDALVESGDHSMVERPQLTNIETFEIDSCKTFKKVWQQLQSTNQLAVLSIEPQQADLFAEPTKFLATPQGVMVVEAHDVTWEFIFTEIKSWTEDPNHQLIGHDLKRTLEKIVLSNLNCRIIDTMLAYYMLASHLGGRYLLTAAIEQYLAYDVTSLNSAQLTSCMLQLPKVLLEGLEKSKMLGLYQALEMPLMGILQQMQHVGVCVDANELLEQSRILGDEITLIEKEVFSEVGHEFNLSSPKQLQAVLYDQLQLPILQKTPKGQPSTSESALEQLAAQHDIVNAIMRHRSLNKLKNTYTDKLPIMIDSVTKRIHGQFNQAVTSTGRLSSSEPNLQNIPIRTEAGRRIRKAFIAKPGHQLVCADYSQIELRIMAHFSRDPKLVAAFHAGKDIHLATAAEVFEVEVPTEAQRRSAKAINFGLIYGMSSFGLANQIGVSRQEAQAYMDVYFKRYPGVKAFMEETRTLAHDQGYVETLLGRRLMVLGINDRNFNRRQAAERAAINAPMQGSAADIIKKAMLDLAGLPFALVLQVHDELVFEVPESCLEDAMQKISTGMVNAVSLDVPLAVNIAAAKNWLEAK